MTPDSKVLGKDDIAALVGKRVSVVSERNKVDYVIALAPKGRGAKAKKKKATAS